jgi:hypothetical protein
VQLSRHFVNQSSEFCRHNPLCCSSMSVYCCKHTFHYDSVRKLLDTPWLPTKQKVPHNYFAMHFIDTGALAQVYPVHISSLIAVSFFPSRPFPGGGGLGIFLFTTASRTALGPTQPPIQWLPVVLSLGIKRPGREADHSPPSSAEVKEWVELYLHSPIRLHGVVLS